MIFDPGTIIVLGAGASTPYGFPLGRQLKQQIIQIMANTTTTQGKQLLEVGFSEKDISDCHTDLIRSIHPTIDAFLEDRPSRRDIGAFAIAQVLMPLEREENLYPHRDWYPTLFEELNLRDYRHVANVTAIVTLNYDRSLEHYLTETTRRTYEEEIRAKALEKLDTVRVIHMHGQLGPYPDMPYTEQRTTDDIRKGAQGISMIHDRHLDTSEVFQDAAQLIATASDVLFLGFGYDQRTLKRLGVFDVRNGPRFHGTAHEMRSEWRREVKKLFEDRIQLNEHNYPIQQYLPHFHSQKLKEREDKAQQSAAPLPSAPRTGPSEGAR